LALAGDKIYASNNSIVGSIGVNGSHFGFTKTIEKLGIERRLNVGGKNKSLFDPFIPRQEESDQIMKGVIDDIHTEFINYVKINRKRMNPNFESKEIMFDGRIFTGKQAKKLGIIDEIDDVDSMLAKN